MIKDINYQVFKPCLIVFMLIIFFIYLILNPPVEEGKRWTIDKQKKVMRIIAIIALIFSLYGFFSVIKDTLFYLKNGESYIKKSECVIKHVSTMPIFFFVKKDIFCKNGQKFKIFFTFNNYFKNEKFIFDYLPNSKVIIDEKILYSPFLKRLKKFKKE